MNNKLDSFHYDLIHALMCMVNQYFSHYGENKEKVSHSWIGAEEYSAEILEELGFLEAEAKGGNGYIMRWDKLEELKLFLTNKNTGN
jgi:hypothetical protein